MKILNLSQNVFYTHRISNAYPMVNSISFTNPNQFDILSALNNNYEKDDARPRRYVMVKNAYRQHVINA